MGNSLNKIDHFFVLMLENRSFDHMLGFSGISGLDQNGAQTKINCLTGNESNPIDPISPDSAVVKVSPDSGLVTNPDPHHEFEDVRMQLCGPGGTYPNLKNNGFIASYKQDSSTPEMIMRCFAKERLPILTSLAQEFAVCDNWHASLPGPTWPNRFFVHAATSGGLDASPSTDATLESFIDGYKFKGGTIYDALDKKKLRWRIYHGDAIPQVLALSGMHEKYLDSALEYCFKDFDDFARDLTDPNFLPSYIFIEPNYGHDLTSDTTKDFSKSNSQHPVSNVADGEQLIKDVYEALRRSPIWEKSALIIVYDEHGGFYDHVLPDRGIPTGDDQKYNKNKFDFKTLGVRVPAVIVSPWIPRSVIDHTLYDHASLLATVNKRFNLDPLTLRDKAVNKFDSLFSLDSPRDTPQTLPPVVRDPSTAVAILSQNGKLDSETMSFLHLAVSLECRTGSAVDHPAIIAHAKTLKTKEDAMAHIADVGRQIKSQRGS